MFGKVNGPMSIPPPPDFNNMKPPTKEEIMQMGEMMKMFGDVEQFIDKVKTGENKKNK